MSSQEFKVGDLVLAHDSENKQKIGVVAEAVDGSIFDSDSCPDQLLFVFFSSHSKRLVTASSLRKANA